MTSLVCSLKLICCRNSAFPNCFIRAWHRYIYDKSPHFTISNPTNDSFYLIEKSALFNVISMKKVKISIQDNVRQFLLLSFLFCSNCFCTLLHVGTIRCTHQCPLLYLLCHGVRCGAWAWLWVCLRMLLTPAILMAGIWVPLYPITPRAIIGYDFYNGFLKILPNLKLIVLHNGYMSVYPCYATIGD